MQPKKSIAEGDFIADIKSSLDYYPFGSLMTGRKYNPGEYRFGFNGQEKDDEIAGVIGSQLDFGARVLDSRLGRWLSNDPLQKIYPDLSPYNSFANNPINFIDKDGEEPREGNQVLKLDFEKAFITLINDDNPKFRKYETFGNSIKSVNFVTWEQKERQATALEIKMHCTS